MPVSRRSQLCLISRALCLYTGFPHWPQAEHLHGSCWTAVGLGFLPWWRAGTFCFILQDLLSWCKQCSCTTKQPPHLCLPPFCSVMELQGCAVPTHPQGCICPETSPAWTPSLPGPQHVTLQGLCYPCCMQPWDTVCFSILNGCLYIINYLLTAERLWARQGCVSHPEHHCFTGSCRAQSKTSYEWIPRVRTQQTHRERGKDIQRCITGHVPPIPCPTHLPGLQLLWEIHLLLDGIQQLAVEGHHVDLALGQLHLHRVLPGETVRNWSVWLSLFIWKEVLNISLRSSQQFLSVASPQVLSCWSPLYSGQLINLKSGT